MLFKIKIWYLLLKLLFLVPMSKTQNAVIQPSRDLIINNSLPTDLNYVMLGSARFYTTCNRPNTVALTYDDGPISNLVNQLLDMLDKEGVKATFFVLGSKIAEDQANKDALGRIARQGHSVGSHGFSHKSFLVLDKDSIAREMRDTEKLIQEATGKNPTLFRPPYGDINAAVAEQISDMGYTMVSWNYDSRDWDYRNSEGQKKIVRDYVQQGKSYIMLYHDIHLTTIESQQDIIRHLKSLNYEFLTVDECISSSKGPSNSTSKSSMSHPFLTPDVTNKNQVENQPTPNAFPKEPTITVPNDASTKPKQKTALKKKNGRCSSRMNSYLQ